MRRLLGNRGVVVLAAMALLVGGWLVFGRAADAAATGRITGKVTATNGTGLAGIRVAPLTGGVSATTAADGSFTLDLPGGVYVIAIVDPTLTYAPELWRDADSMAGVQPQFVVPGSTITINPRLGLAGSITGTITAGATPLAGVRVDTELTRLLPAFAPNGPTLTDAAGNFTLRGVTPGKRRVLFSDDQKRFPEFEWNGGATGAPIGQGATVTVAEGQTVAGISPGVSLGGGTISGTVTDTAGVPLDRVVVTAATSLLNVKRATTAADGTYSIGALAPGQYLVSLSDPLGRVLPEFWENKSTPETATRVTVSGSGVVTVSPQMDRRSAIEGTVRDPQGAGVPNVLVIPDDNLSAAVRTTATGTYRINVTPGRPTVLRFLDVTYRLAAEYWDNAPSRAAATPITVAAGVTRTGTDVLLDAPVSVCDGVPATRVGTPGTDWIVGTEGRDVIAALGGDDIVVGLGGDDLICGGDGNDVVFGGKGADRVLGGLGNDNLNGDDGPDQLSGEAGVDQLNGGVGDDNILAGDGADRAAGQAGDDRIEGGVGADQLLGGPGRDWLTDPDGTALNGGSDDDVCGGVGTRVACEG